MQPKRIENASVIVPLVFAVVAVSLLARYVKLPTWLFGLGIAAVAIAIPCVVAFLIVEQSGWRALARNYPGIASPDRAWRMCRTAVMSTVGIDDPRYRRSKVRLSRILRVGPEDGGLQLSAIWPFALLFPPLRIPWSAISRVRYFDPAPWFNYPGGGSGLRLQLNYDPGYNEKFAEIQIADPVSFLQLPAGLLPELVARFPA